MPVLPADADARRIFLQHLLDHASERPIETERGEAVAPLAYGSALAGFLLGRVVAEPAGDYRRFRVDFIRGLRTPMRTNPRQRESCPYCSNEIARNVYSTRWRHEAT